MNENLDFTMSIEEFNRRCLPHGPTSAEFELLPVNIAKKDSVSWKIETKDNEVYFYKVVENAM